jgi:hypothetical protein
MDAVDLIKWIVIAGVIVIVIVAFAVQALKMAK